MQWKPTTANRHPPTNSNARTASETGNREIKCRLTNFEDGGGAGAWGNIIKGHPHLNKSTSKCLHTTLAMVQVKCFAVQLMFFT